jgi:hypothetical protein
MVPNVCLPVSQGIYASAWLQRVTKDLSNCSYAALIRNLSNVQRQVNGSSVIRASFTAFSIHNTTATVLPANAAVTMYHDTGHAQESPSQPPHVHADDSICHVCGTGAKHHLVCYEKISQNLPFYNSVVEASTSSAPDIDRTTPSTAEEVETDRPKSLGEVSNLDKHIKPR